MQNNQPIKAKKVWQTPTVDLLDRGYVEGGGPFHYDHEVHTANKSKVTSTVNHMVFPVGTSAFHNYHS